MSEFKLYQMNEQLEEVLNNIYTIAENNDGEIPDNWNDALDTITMERKHKVLDIARYIKDLNYRATIIKTEIDQLNKRFKMYSNLSNRIKNYLADNIATGEKFEDSNTKISWRKSKRVIIDDESKLPPFYFKIEKKPMLSVIKKDLDIGAICCGVHIEENNNIQIR